MTWDAQHVQGRVQARPVGGPGADAAGGRAGCRRGRWEGRVQAQQVRGQGTGAAGERAGRRRNR